MAVCHISRSNIMCFKTGVHDITGDIMKCTLKTVTLTDTKVQTIKNAIVDAIDDFGLSLKEKTHG